MINNTNLATSGSPADITIVLYGKPCDDKMIKG